MFVENDPLGNPVDRRHPWNQHTNPKPQKRDLDDKYSWVMSPRWFDGKDYLALDTGGGPLARLWSTALAGLVDIGYVKSTGTSVKINLPKTALKGPVELEWKIPQWSNTIERNRARTYFQAYAAACALHFAEKALVEIRAGRTKTWEKFEVPEEGIGCGFTEAVRGVLSHHMVIRDGKIANYHPYPPTPWNANPRDCYGTPGPYEDAVQGQPIFEENDREHFKGIDIMRTVRSFDPCLPCGVHMYLGEGRSWSCCTPRRSPSAASRACRRRSGPTPPTRGATGDRIDASSTPARRVAPWRASAPRSWCGWSSTSTAPGSSGSSTSCTSAAGSTTTCSRARGGRPRREPAAGSRAASVRRRDACRAGARRRPALPRLPRRRRRAARRQRGRRGATAAPRQLRRLPVLLGDPQARRRGRDRGRRAGDHRHRGGGGTRPPPQGATDPRAVAVRPSRGVGLSDDDRRGRTRGTRFRSSPTWRPAPSRTSRSGRRRCWPAGSAATCSPSATACARADGPWTGLSLARRLGGAVGDAVLRCPACRPTTTCDARAPVSTTTRCI